MNKELVLLSVLFGFFGVAVTFVPAKLPETINGQVIEVVKLFPVFPGD